MIAVQETQLSINAKTIDSLNLIAKTIKPTILNEKYLQGHVEIQTIDENGNGLISITQSKDKFHKETWIPFSGKDIKSKNKFMGTERPLFCFRAYRYNDIYFAKDFIECAQISKKLTPEETKDLIDEKQFINPHLYYPPGLHAESSAHRTGHIKGGGNGQVAIEGKLRFKAELLDGGFVVLPTTPSTISEEIPIYYVYKFPEEFYEEEDENGETIQYRIVEKYSFNENFPH
jgi:hypothetical protein